jgi:hypothetical protein
MEHSGPKESSSPHRGVTTTTITPTKVTITTSPIAESALHNRDHGEEERYARLSWMIDDAALRRSRSLSAQGLVDPRGNTVSKSDILRCVKYVLEMSGDDAEGGARVDAQSVVNAVCMLLGSDDGVVVAADAKVLLERALTSQQQRPIPTALKVADTTSSTSKKMESPPAQAGVWVRTLAAEGVHPALPYWFNTLTRESRWTAPNEVLRSTTLQRKDGGASTSSVDAIAARLRFEARRLKRL